MKKHLVCLIVIGITFFLAATVSAATLFGPSAYTRTTGEAEFYTESFDAVPGEYYLFVKNGNDDKTNRVSSAYIYLNDELIFDPNDFEQNEAMLMAPIQANNTNTLKVELTSAPDSFLTIEIQTSGSAVFSPGQYIRTKGKTDIYTDSFTATPGDGFLMVKNGNKDGSSRVTSGSIVINGELLFETDDFKSDDFILVSYLNLSDTNTITTELNSKPGTYLSVEIVQQGTSVSFNCSPVSIFVGQSATLTWSSASAETVSIDNGIGNVALTGSLTVSPTETTTYTITATGAEGAVSKQVMLNVSVAPQPVVTLDASQTDIFEGESVILSWTSSHADTCVITPNIESGALNGSVDVAPTVTTTYTITATGYGGTATSSVTVTVTPIPVPAVSITATPETILSVGISTLSWNAENADSISIEPGIGPVDAAGSYTVTPAETTTYTITATGPGGSVSDQATVTVSIIPQPVVTLNASSTDIFEGDSVILTWTSTDADTCEILPNIGSVALNGSVEVTPTATTTYALTATGPGGTTTSSVTITVSPIPVPVVTLTANPESIFEGESSVLSWDSANVTDAEIDQGVGTVSLSGSLPVSPAETTTYTITVIGPEGAATDSVTITVSAPPLPIVSISATPATIASGETTELSWYSEYADTCVISPDIGAIALSGSEIISPERTTTYIITATGAGGSATAQVKVIVASQTDPLPEGSFGSQYEDLIPPDATLQTYDAERFSLINGTILDTQGSPIQGVNVGILHHLEYGTAITDSEGSFSLPVEGGSSMTAVYTLDGLITSHRSVDVPWNGFAIIDPIVMIPVDTKSTTIAFDGNPATVMSHISTPVSDEFGTRSCTLIFTGDNRAYEVDANGNTIRELNSGTVRATEFFTIEAMPSVLPPTSAYTYCSELAFDEAQRVQFQKPVVVWVDNFLGFDVGSIVPIGYYDRDKGVWVPSDNGVVVKLLDTNGDGIVDAIDADGDNLADDLNGDGTTADEALGLEDPSLYVPGTSFWRSEITHFTPYDCNWPYGPDKDAIDPNAEGKTGTGEGEEDCQTSTGSFIMDRSRVFHEDITIPGTDITLHYASNRVGADNKTIITVPASGTTVPASLKRIEVSLNIAGQKFQQTLDPLPDQVAVFTWEGTDFRNALFAGPVQAGIQVGFVYDAVYYSPGEFAQAFAQVGPNVTEIQARQEVAIWRYEQVIVERDYADVVAEGWTLSPHHRFYAHDLTRIYKGDGSTDIYSPNLLNRFAGIITPGYAGDDGPAAQAQLDNPTGVAVDGEGNVYIADTNNHRIRKVDTDGIITTVAGNGTAGYGGDTGPAMSAQLNGPRGIMFDDSGNLFIADTLNHRIRKVTSDGIITTIAGNGSIMFSGDDGPATSASLYYPQGVAVDSSGNVYVADTEHNRIRKISPNAIITTIAGNGGAYYYGDGGPATMAALFCPKDVETDNKGNIFIADSFNSCIRKIDNSGIITTVAGNGIAGPAAEGVPATDTSLNSPAALALDEQGNIYIADTANHKIRKVNVLGIINTLAGDGSIGIKTGVPPKEGRVPYPLGIAVGPSSQVYFSAIYDGYIACVLNTGGSGIGSLVSGDGQAYSDPSGETYIIKNGNQHTATQDSNTGALLRYFSYDSNDRLVYIYDRGMNRTTIERDFNGVPTAIISPDGIRTELTVDFQNRLKEVRYPDGGYYSFEYSSGGLETAKVDPNGNRYEHVFDPNGKITDATDAEGGHWCYDVTNNADGTIRTEMTTAEGQQTVYLDRTLPSGEYTSLITGPSGGITDYRKSENGLTVNKSLSCGMDMLFEYAYDPGYRFKYIKSRTLSQPSGLSKTVTEDRLYEDIDNDRILDKTTKTLTVNGNAFTYLIDKPQTQKTLTTPEGRISSSGFDPDTGLTTWTSTPGLFDTAYTYDTRGRLVDVTASTRKSTFGYDADGNLASVTDPENRTTTFSYDPMGRATSMHRPDNTSAWFDYDKNGNMTVLTNPLSVDHGFEYNSVDRNTSYQMPLSGSYSYVYDRDRRLTKTIFPSAKEINNIYDIDYPGRLMQVQTPEGNIDYSYYPCGGKIATITKGSEGIAYDYDGNLLTGKTLSGTLNTSVAMTYNNFFDIDSFSYAGGTEVFTYDMDNLLTSAGRFTIIRNVANGLPESVTSSSFALSRTFNGYGEIGTQSVSVSGQSLSAWNLTMDNTGRIKAKTETVGGTNSDFVYTYDEMGRLLTVTQDGSFVEEYQYNANGSRIYEMNAQRGVAGRSLVYSQEDHLLTAGNVEYAYDPDGFLLSKTEGSDVTSYDYSSQGELLSVGLSSGGYVEYVHDPQGRRIAKKINGAIVEKYLWQGLTRLLAVYDGSNNLVTRFEYADSRMPYAMTKSGVVYYLTYDQVGSLRIVADGSGNVVKRIDYDTFGNIIADTDPTFEVPFGFAGGLHDRDTGLVRFGYRDYDPETGRWTAKDPIGFAGGDTDLYGYCLNDPVNNFDPDGRIVFVLTMTAGYTAVHAIADLAIIGALGYTAQNALEAGLDGPNDPTDPREWIDWANERDQNIQNDTKACETETTWQGPEYDPDQPPDPEDPFWKKILYTTGKIIKLIKGWPH